jgi:hypothetical protein
LQAPRTHPPTNPPNQTPQALNAVGIAASQAGAGIIGAAGELATAPLLAKAKAVRQTHTALLAEVRRCSRLPLRVWARGTNSTCYLSAT